MAKIETVEYYANCPNCGSPRAEGEACAYCGSSLVKSRSVRDVATPAQPEADPFAAQDAGLPVIKGKSGHVSPFMKIFCPIFGGTFLAVSTIILVTFTAVGFMDLWMLLFLAPFFIIGICGLAPLVIAVVNNRKCKSGQRVVASIRGYDDAIYTINGKPGKIVRLRVDEGGSRIVELDTGETRCLYAIGSRVNLLTDGTHFIIEGPATNPSPIS